MVKNPIKNYKFWFKLFGGVILLVFAIAMIFNRQFGEKMVVGIFGGIILLYGLYRIFPLIKTLEKPWSKRLCLVEILIDIIVGAMMLVGGFNFASDANDYTEFMRNNFRFFLGAVVYLRGLIYCITSIIVGEKSDYKQFIANIICITFGVVIMCLEQFNASNLVWVMIALAFISGAYIVSEGGYDYGKYRKEFKENRDSTEKEETDELKDGVEKGEKKEEPEVIIPEQIDNNVDGDQIN